MCECGRVYESVELGESAGVGMLFFSLSLM